MKHLPYRGIPMLIMLLAPAFLFASPERESTQGMEFLEACTKCHGETPDYPLLGAALEYEASGHRNNGNSHYANGNGCQACHTNEGFIEFVETGKVEGYVSIPSQPGCFTCHTPHTTGDFSLRTIKPVTLANGATFDVGAGNLCASCHMARTDAREAVEPMAANAIRGHFGAHHGPQADILMGTNAFEFPGREYSSSEHRDIIRDGCAICHMSLPKARYSMSPEVGGHSFSIAGEVHEQHVLNVSGCVNCHEDIAQVRGKEVFNIMSEKDFDLDGLTEPVQEEVIGLLKAFSNEEGTGVLQTLEPPFYNPDGSWNQVAGDDQRSATEVAALYNYKMILEDRSNGVHNAIYTIQILYDTLKALDPTFDDSLRPE